MSIPRKIDSSEEKESVAKAKDGFIRTVRLDMSDAAGTFDKTKTLEKRSTPKQKEEFKDIVRGVNINPYISSSLDISPDLFAPLDNIEQKYTVLEEFAQGGFATISIARDKNLGRLVAVKTLNKGREGNEELLNSFVTEAKVTAQLDHPGIIPIYGLFLDKDNGIHLVMKLVDGKTLREYIRNTTLNYRVRGIDAFDESMMLRTRLEIFLHVCDTISYAHHRNVIHRDLKPENIMIGKYMEVFVMDWGIARILPKGQASTLPDNEQITGSPGYFAPEVLRRERLDLRSDIFSLGLILQEIVTLQHAIEGKDEKDCMKNIVNGVFAPIEHLYHLKIDSSLQAIIQKATAYSLDERYQTVDELAEDLRRYMAHLPISIKRDNLWNRILRFFFGNHQ